MEAAWGAFGSDSDSDDDDVAENNEQAQPNALFESTAASATVAITQHFCSLTKATGVGLGERVVAITSVLHGNERGEEAVVLRTMMTEWVIRRGMKVAALDDASSACDSAVLIVGDTDDLHSSSSLNIRRRLLPGGVVWLIIKHQENEIGNISFDCFSQSIWEGISCVSTSSAYSVHKIQKRACLVNAMSCPWMDKKSTIEREVALAAEKTCGNLQVVVENERESYIQCELRLASQVTIVPSVAERTREKIHSESCAGEVYATILTDANIKHAIRTLREHGLVIIKGLLPPEQTIPWGNVVLEDFTSAVEALKNHQSRPVDLLNPDKGLFEPLSYKEMAMREDLRVDLRSGPSMEKLRSRENNLASQAMVGSNITDIGNQPTIITADTMGTAGPSWRYHPSILAILKGLFNPRDDSLYKGNFGRWNFGGNGPDGSPQPFRLGQIGSVVSCPGSGDQAIHADTPHLFEHMDCHPCHYCNVFTPGYKITNQEDNPSVQNEFVDGLWTGSSTMGGTALVYNSHRLSVSAMLLSEGDDDGNEKDNASLRRQLLQLLTLRPALDAGDVVIFDNRTLHYGIANTSKGDTTGKDSNAGRRPMLYLNVTQSWFHDPKNWDDRESIFS